MMHVLNINILYAENYGNLTNYIVQIELLQLLDSDIKELTKKKIQSDGGYCTLCVWDTRPLGIKVIPQAPPILESFKNVSFSDLGFKGHQKAAGS